MLPRPGFQALGQASSMTSSKTGHIWANVEIGDWRAPALSVVAWFALAAMVLVTAVPARSMTAAPFLNFYCAYGDTGASKAQSEGFNFSFQPDVPYDFIDMFGFGHSIRSTTVTQDQVVEQSVMMNDSIHPSRAEVFDVTVMDRQTQKFRRLIYKVDPKTRDRKVEMDRSGQCTPVKARAAR
jgi:hypothetical protein